MRTRAGLFLLFSAALAPAALGLAPPRAPTRHEVEASFLCDLTRFVEWPLQAFPDARAPFRLCVLGAAPFAPELERIAADRRVKGRPIAVSRLSGAGEAAGCHLLFVGAGSPDARGAIAALGGAPALTVGEGAGFLDAGGAIAAAWGDGRVLFDVDLGAAARARLKISSKLLRLAGLVRGAAR